MSRGRASWTWVMVVVMAGVGCGKSHTASTTPGPLTGSLTVFAAASLTEAFGDEKAALTRRHPSLKLTSSFAGSSALVTQIEQGAPADVFASADEANMEKLLAAGLVETPTVFARNMLEIAVAPDNPKHVNGLTDLARSDLIVVLVDPSVPAGKYGLQALQHAGVAAQPRSLELDVKAALAKVTAGEADAAIVYATDVRAAGNRAAAVPIPEAQNVIATYPIAVVKATKNPNAAAAFVTELVSGIGQNTLRARGFLAPV